MKNVIVKKRFIAGAVCPDCRLVDKTYVLRSRDALGQQSESRHCVSCGFEEIKMADDEGQNEKSGQLSREEMVPSNDLSPSVTEEWRPIRVLNPDGD